MIYAMIALVAVLLIGVIIGVSYVKAPPDTAFIISGAGKRKVIAGKASFRIPFFQRIDKLFLKLIPIDVKTSSEVPTADYINIKVDAVVNVKVNNKPEMVDIAAQNFLNQSTDYIAKVRAKYLKVICVRLLVR